MQMPKKIGDALILGLVVLIFCVGFVFAVDKLSSVKIPGLNSGIIEPSKKQELITDGEGKFLVQKQNAPDSINDIESAYAISLLPSNVSRGIEYDATIDSENKKLIVKSIENFLPAWETFNPQDMLYFNSGRSGKSVSGYQESIADYTDPTNIVDIVNRKESQDPPDVCTTCKAGLTWAGGTDFEDSLKFARYDGTKVYFTLNAVVEYAGGGVSDLSDGELYNREYGVFMKKIDNRWLVSRIVADSQLINE